MVDVKVSLNINDVKYKYSRKTGQQQTKRCS